jgi:histone H3/H4
MSPTIEKPTSTFEEEEEREIDHDSDDDKDHRFSEEITEEFPSGMDLSSAHLTDSRDSLTRSSLEIDMETPMEDTTLTLSELNSVAGQKDMQDNSTHTVSDHESTIDKVSRRSSSGLPKSLVTQLFTSFSRKRPTRDAIQLVNEISEKYLKQVSQDLTTYAAHAKRKTIEPEDVLCLFRRQKLVDNQHALEDLIRHHLPLENVEDLLPIARAHNVVVPKDKR